MCIGVDNELDCGVYHEHAGPAYWPAERCVTFRVVINDREWRLPHCPGSPHWLDSGSENISIGFCRRVPGSRVDRNRSRGIRPQ